MLILRFFSQIMNQLKLRLVRRKIRRAKHILALIELAALTRLRLHFSLPLEGTNETLDLQLENALRKYLYLDFSETNSEDREDIYLAYLTNDASSKTDREAYFRVKYWLNSGTEEAEPIAQFYKSLNQKEIAPISESELRPMFADVRRRYRTQDREHRESKASLIEISLRDLNLLLPWISLLIVVSGYFHTSVLYGKLGIDYDQFYSVGDYISSSVNQLPHALVGVAAFAVGIIYAHRKLSTETKNERAQFRRQVGWFSTLFCVSCIGLLILLYVKSLFLPIIPILAIGATQPVVIYVSGKYFRKSLPVYIGMMFLIIFFSGIYAAAHSRFEEIMAGEVNREFELKISGRTYTETDFHIIGSNSQYMFLYSREGAIEVIPLSKVERVAFDYEGQ